MQVSESPALSVLSESCNGVFELLERLRSESLAFFADQKITDRGAKFGRCLRWRYLAEKVRDGIVERVLIS